MNIDEKDKYGWTALMAAEWYCLVDLDIKNKYGKTVKEIAVDRGYKALADFIQREIFIEKGEK